MRARSCGRVPGALLAVLIPRASAADAIRQAYEARFRPQDLGAVSRWLERNIDAINAALWIPYVVAQVVTNGLLGPGNYRDPTPRPLPLWGKRTDRTYLNAWETFAPFAALVLIIHVTGKANAATAFWSMFFFWARASHAAVYLLAIPYLRTLIFTAGFVAVGALFWELIR